MAAAVWASGFRPFYLGGAIYALVAVVLWAVGEIGDVGRYGSAAWHGHEMVFGFVGATCGGFLLTALPSWAHAAPVVGARLAVLAALWLAGRLAMLLPLPPVLQGAVDLLFLPALLLMLLPGVWAAADRRYRLVVAILLGLIAGNVIFHAGWVHLGNMAGLYVLMVLFSFVGGLLTPIFTETALNQDGWPGRIGFDRTIEVVAPLSLVALGLADLVGLRQATAGLALLAAVVHGLRMAGWHGRMILDRPLLLAMHVGYAWLVAALLMKAVGTLAAGAAVSPVMVHAFTLGALSLTKISLMTRVVLKHTGRPVPMGGPMAIGYSAMVAAAVLRLLAEFTPGRGALLAAAVVLWCLPFALYLALYGRHLLAPSLPRKKKAPLPRPGEGQGLGWVGEVTSPDANRRP